MKGTCEVVEDLTAHLIWLSGAHRGEWWLVPFDLSGGMALHLLGCAPAFFENATQRPHQGEKYAIVRSCRERNVEVP